MKSVYFSILLLAFMFVLPSCSDNNELIGSSIDESSITIHSDSSLVYTANSDSLSSRSSSRVVNRAVYHMLGEIDIPSFASINADYLTEMRYIGVIDLNLVKSNMLDSMVLTLKYVVNQTIGDKFAPMRITAYQLDKTIAPKSGDTLFTNLNPADYCNFNTQLGEKVFSPYSTLDTVNLKFPISREGITTKEWATKFYEYYIQKGGNISQSDMQSYFPGLYVTHTYGSGSVVRVVSTIISLYHKSYVYDAYGKIAITDGKEKIVNAITPILVSGQEVESVSHMDVKWSSNIQSLAQAGKPIITTPVGYQTYITLPIKNIIKAYTEAVSKQGVIGVINSVSLSLPIVRQQKNDYNIVPPPYLLLMRADANAADSDHKIVHTTPNIFFYDRMLPDNINTFYATYSSSTNSYEFVNMQSYISNILKYNPNNGNQNDYKGDSDMVLVPVDIKSNTSGAITSMFPYLTAPRFVQIDTENIKIKFIYSTKLY